MLNSTEPAEHLTIYIALILFAVLALALTIILLFFVSRKKIVQEKLEAQELKIKHKRLYLKSKLGYTLLRTLHCLKKGKRSQLGLEEGKCQHPSN